MGCHLTFQIQVPPAELLSRIQKLAQEYEGQFQGDEKSGRIALHFILGSIEGDYIIEGDKLHLNITKKPFLVGCETIRAMITENVPVLA
jgi:hypothetical protein